MQKWSFIGMLFGLCCCSVEKNAAEVPAPLVAPRSVDTVVKPVRSFDQQYFHPDSILIAKVDSVYQAMSVQERAAQMIMVASAPSLGIPYGRAKSYVLQSIAANVLFLKGSKSAFIQQAAALKKIQADSGRLTTLFACDCEPSLMHKKIIGAKYVGYTSKIKTEKQSEEAAMAIVQEIKPLDIGLNFAPVTDNAQNKAIIGNRSYGLRSEKIAALAGSFVKATQAHQIAATLKHFPGHGAVYGDTHKESVFINGALSEINTFKTVIDSAKPIAVLVAHIIVKNNPQYQTQQLPATLSQNIVTNLLRRELGFDGIIATDAMNMGAVRKIANADYKAALAGCDLIVMPMNPVKLHRQIVEELSQQSPQAAAFEQSIRRIIRLKLLQQSATTP